LDAVNVIDIQKIIKS